MDVGAWIALSSAIVAFLAMSVAIWQAAEARRSRRAAESQANSAADQARSSERSASAAEEQVALARTEAMRQREERVALEAAQARLVTPQVSGMGALAVEITNDSTVPIYFVEVEEYRSEVFPTASWQLLRTVMGVQNPCHSIQPGETYRFPIELVASDGKPLNFAHHMGQLANDHPTVTF